jgi:hypothetical protein
MLIPAVGVHPVSCSVAKALTAYHRVLPRLRMSGVIPLLPLYAFMACTGEALAFYHRVESIKVALWRGSVRLKVEL